jgi:hypothetical protein
MKWEMTWKQAVIVVVGAIIIAGGFIALVIAT